MALRFPAFNNATIRQPRWLRAGDLAFSAWVKLACRCAEDENAGRFGGAKTWDERMWLTLANVTQAGLDAALAADLVRWQGDTLVVLGYDNAAETKVAAARAGGAFGHLGAEHGKKGGRPRKSAPVQNPVQNQKPPQGVFEKPPLTSPYPSDPDRVVSAEAGEVEVLPGHPPQEAIAPQSASGEAGGGSWRWGAAEWYRRFADAWFAEKGTFYGRGGDRDTRACGELAEVLASMPEAEVRATQEAAPKLFAWFFKHSGEEADRAGHLFSWFVARLNGIRDQVARGPAAAPRRATGYAVVKGRKNWHAGMEKAKGRESA